MRFVFLAFIAALLLVSVPAEAKLIDNPEAVSYLHASVSKSGSIVLEPKSGLARVDSVDLQLSIPQDTERQKSELLEVSGPDSYEFERDEWGNEVLMLHWDSPQAGSVLDYSVSFDVEVSDREERVSGREFSLTDITYPTPEIKKTAYSVVKGKSDLEAMLALTEWVYRNVDYREEYQGSKNSADWVFRNRKAVCSGEANLLISLLRSLGYNARYAAGYAYTETTPVPGTYWGSHAWVEAEYNGSVVTLDPTWMESPIDATHIKFSVSPDSNYSEYIWVMSRDVGVRWERGEAEISLLEKKEEPRVSIEARTVPDSMRPESYGLILANLTSDYQCVLGKIEARGCTDSSGRDFLTIYDANRSMLFCGSQEVFWLMESPGIEKGMLYTCPLSVYGGGASEKIPVRIEEGRGSVSLTLSSPRVLSPGEVFSPEIVVENRGFSGFMGDVYLVFDNEIKRENASVPGMSSLGMIWSLKAPENPGIYSILAFSSSGDVAQGEVRVVKERAIRIENVSFGRFMVRKHAVINVTVRALKDFDGKIVVSVDGNSSERNLSLAEGKSETIEFSYTPMSEGTLRLSVDAISSSGYEDGVLLSIEAEGEKDITSRLVSMLRGFLDWMLSLLGWSG